MLVLQVSNMSTVTCQKCCASSCGHVSFNMSSCIEASFHMLEDELLWCKSSGPQLAEDPFRINTLKLLKERSGELVR